MLNMKKLMTKMLKGDFVIEEGTTGIWTYRKWASGVAECWGAENKVTPVTTAWGNGYVSPQLSTLFPSDFFTSAPIVSIYFSGGYSAIVNNSNSSPSKNGVNYGIFRPTQSASQTFVANIRAIGKWK